jgi:hypothetical protein
MVRAWRKSTSLARLCSRPFSVAAAGSATGIAAKSVSTLRQARLLLSVHYAASGHLFCLIRHPLIIAPIGAQRQALLTLATSGSRARLHRNSLGEDLDGGIRHGDTCEPFVFRRNDIHGATSVEVSANMSSSAAR